MKKKHAKQLIHFDFFWHPGLFCHFDLNCLPVNSEQWIKLECKSAVWLPSKHRVGKETETTRSNNNETLAGLWSTFPNFVHNNTRKTS